MALLHAATISPAKPELVAAYLAARDWLPGGDVVPEVVGAYRFDDPEGTVGLETHLVRCGDDVVQVPLTYRAAPLEGAEDALVGTMEHSVLGTRWVHDGLADPAYVGMLAAVTLTGAGQSVGVLHREGRALVRPPSVRLHWSGWTIDSAAVDRFGPPTRHGTASVVESSDVVLTFEHLPEHADAVPDDAFLLTGSWAGRSEPAPLVAGRLSLDPPIVGVASVTNRV